MTMSQGEVWLVNLDPTTSQVESAHVRGLEFVAELARRRGVGLSEMMNELGLGKFDD